MDETFNSQEFVSVYKAQDEVTAYLVKGVLEEAGIEAVVRSRQVPWMDGIMSLAEGYWGDVMVLEEKRDESLAVIEGYAAPPDAE